jgi:DNA-binding CsgD family transcriptional regulator
VSDQVAGDRTLPTLADANDSHPEPPPSPPAPPAAAEPDEPAKPLCPYCGAADPPARDAVLRAAGLRATVLSANLPQHIAAALVRTRNLTPREMTVFELLGLGYDNRSLARLLDVSERTTKRHVTAILTKLGLESRLQAGLVALLTASLQPRPPGGPKVAWTGTTKADNTELGARPRSTEVGRTADGGLVRGRISMVFDSLAALRAAGNPVDLLTEEQQAVFASLSEDEVALLNSIKMRLDSLEESEVMAHDLKIL